MIDNEKYRYDKDDSYYLEVCKKVYRMYADGWTHLNPLGVRNEGTSRRSVKELRDYGRGVIDVRKFQDRLDPKIDKGKNRGRRRWNISWDPLRVYSKTRNIMKSKISSLVLVPSTQAIDEEARLERMMKKNRAKLLRNDNMKMFMQGTGFVPEEPQDMAGVETQEEIDMLYEMGGIRLAAEIKMKDAIDKLMENSSWSVISGMAIEDIIDLNGLAVDQVSENGMEVLKYVDASKVVVRPSIYPDFRDTDFRGYVTYMRINEIIDRDPTVDKKMLRDLAKRQARVGNYGSLGRGYGHREDYARGSSMNYDLYNDDFGIQVMKLYWIDEEVSRYVTGYRKGGVRQFEKVDPDFELSKRGQKAGKEIEEVAIHKLYECHWVIDTDVIFGFGEVDTIVKEGQPGSKKVVWPMTIYMEDEMSVTEKCISFDDDLQTNLFKMRHLISKLPPGPRMVIFQSMVSDTVQLGDETYTILDMYANFQREGLFVVNDSESYQLPGEDNSYGKSPVMPIPIDVQNDYNMFRQGMLDAIENMRQVTGINEFVDGTSNKPDTLKHVAASMGEAANNAIKPYVMLYTEAFQAICKFGAMKFQLKALDGPVKLGVASTIDQYIRDVTLDKEVFKHDWRISVSVYSDETRQMLIQELQLRKEQIPVATYFSIWNMIMDGDFKKAEWRLAVEVKRAEKEAHQKQLEIAQATASGNAQAVVAGEQAKAKTISAQSNAKIQEIKFQTDEDIRKARELMGMEMQKAQQEAKLMEERELKVVRANNQNRLNQ